jgi:hypothetical protein
MAVPTHCTGWKATRAMVVLAGVAAGLLGALMMAILFNVQYAAFGYHEGSLQYGTEAEARQRGR